MIFIRPAAVATGFMVSPAGDDFTPQDFVLFPRPVLERFRRFM